MSRLEGFSVGKSGYREVGGAWIHPQSEIAEKVIVEPGAVVGPGVRIGSGSWIGARAMIFGPTILGESNRVHPTAILGGAPQDAGYQEQLTRLLIGDRNVFREGTTVSRASGKGDGATRLGNDNYLMSGSHVGHDCVIGDQVVLSNDVLIAGHCHVGSNVSMAPGAAIVQFCTVGRYASIGWLIGSTMDCEPFIIHDDMPARHRGINVLALRQGGFPEEVIEKLGAAYQLLFTGSDKCVEDLEAAQAEIKKRGADCAEVLELIEFMKGSRTGRFGRRLQAPQKP
jgi:UDP-N-acetylglucosamine acyltransferase